MSRIGGRARENERRHPPGPFVRKTQAPDTADRMSDEGRALDLERVEERREKRDRVSSEIDSGVEEAVAEAAARAVDSDQAAPGQLGHERRPDRRLQAAAVNEDDGLAGADREDARSDPRLGKLEETRLHVEAQRAKRRCSVASNAVVSRSAMPRNRWHGNVTIGTTSRLFRSDDRHHDTSPPTTMPSANGGWGFEPTRRLSSA